MFALRYLSVLALVAWVGGLVVVGGIAAPSAFDVLVAQGTDGRVLAGTVSGETLRRFHLLTYGCAGVLLLTLLARRVLGPRPRRFAVRFVIAVLMLAASAYAGMTVSAPGPRDRATRAAASSIEQRDFTLLAFGGLHATSTLLELIPLAGGLALLFWELRD